jgi:hypothetical protein
MIHEEMTYEFLYFLIYSLVFLMNDSSVLPTPISQLTLWTKSGGRRE